MKSKPENQCPTGPPQIPLCFIWTSWMPTRVFHDLSKRWMRLHGLIKPVTSLIHGPLHTQLLPGCQSHIVGFSGHAAARGSGGRLQNVSGANADIKLCAENKKWRCCCFCWDSFDNHCWVVVQQDSPTLLPIPATCL